MAVRAPSSELDTLRRRADRERAARLEAERIAEVGLRQLYEQRENLQLLEAIAVAANSTKSVAEVFEFAASEICRHKQWPIGHAYMRVQRGDAERLVPAQIWHMDDPSRLEPFVRATSSTDFESGVGLPGRV